MGSSFLGIEIAKRGVLAHQTALNTVSNNLSNSSNEDYSRQQVNMKTMHPLYKPALNRESGAGQIGQGPTVASIERIRDEFIDKRIMEESSAMGHYDVRYKFLKQIEQVFNEPGQPTLKEKFDGFVRSWNDLALDPASPAAREALVTSSQNMLGFVKDHYGNLDKLRGHVDGLIREKASEINHMAKQIRDLNVEIVKVEAMGDNPNDLLDKRDALLEDIAKITDIQVVRNDPDEIFVYMNSRPLIQGTKISEIKVVNDPENNGMANLIWENGEPLSLGRGELKALMEVRDKDVLGVMKKLNNFVVQMADSVNEVHREGFGLNPVTGLNFFETRSITPQTNGNYDADKDGQYDSTRLFKVRGTQKLTGQEPIGEDGVMNLGPDETGKDIVITYRGTDRVQDVLDRINQSPARVNAYLDHQGRVNLKALYSETKDNPDFAIRHLEDSGPFLTSFTGILNQSGEEGAFDYRKINQTEQLATDRFTVTFQNNAAQWMSVDESILNNSMNIAVRLGKDIDGDGMLDIPRGKGDGRNAFRIMSVLVSETEKNGLDQNTKLDHMPVMVDKNTKSFRPFLDRLVTGVGEQAKSDKMNLDKEEKLLLSLKNTRESISGVNIDEELVNLIKFQHGYQASAKIMQTMDKMLDVIMGLGR
jgi:flagellar hook-associated protein 1 FlgK